MQTKLNFFSEGKSKWNFLVFLVYTRFTRNQLCILTVTSEQVLLKLKLLMYISMFWGVDYNSLWAVPYAACGPGIRKLIHSGVICTAGEKKVHNTMCTKEAMVFNTGRISSNSEDKIIILLTM